MKKTALTFVAVAFGTCVAFAQTTPQNEKQETKAAQTLTLDKMSDKPQANRKSLKLEELPAAVQANLKADEFKNFKILTVTEVQGGDATKPEMVQYEIGMLESTAEVVDVPSLLVLFDDKGKLLASTKVPAQKND